MRGAAAAGVVLGLGLACGAREPRPPNACDFVLSGDPPVPGAEEAERIVREEFLGRTDLDVRCGDAVHRLHLDLPDRAPGGKRPLEPKPWRPRGRCRTVLTASSYGQLTHDDGGEDRYGHEVRWELTVTEDGRLTAHLDSIPLGIDLDRDAAGTWTAVARTCEDRPPVCAALQREPCVITATRSVRPP